jgi:hypothetical protein
MTYTTPLENKNINTLDNQTFVYYNILINFTTKTTGSLTLSGLNIDWIPTTMTVGDTVTPIPAVPLPERNSIIVYNQSVDTLYIGKANVTADSVVGTTSGWQIPGKSYFAIDVRDTIIIYGICETGKSVQVQTLEVA